MILDNENENFKIIYFIFYVLKKSINKLVVEFNMKKALFIFIILYLALTSQIILSQNQKTQNNFENKVQELERRIKQLEQKLNTEYYINEDYETVQIGTQKWMQRNLDVSTYRNGDSIKYIDNDQDWIDAGNKKEGAWCYYNNDPVNGAIYGKLYNWYAVNDSRGLAPSGYHVPSDEEWTVLTNYLGGEIVAGGKLKEAGTTHWYSPNDGATNSNGFSALPGGFRFIYGNRDLRDSGYWWSATEYGDTSAWLRSLYYHGTFIYRSYYYKVEGFSVRCIKD
jgi:uncharacterized protein (TIGR02145 family)